jgi:hypothetical protein
MAPVALQRCHPIGAGALLVHAAEVIEWPFPTRRNSRQLVKNVTARCGD